MLQRSLELLILGLACGTGGGSGAASTQVRAKAGPHAFSLRIVLAFVLGCLLSSQGYAERSSGTVHFRSPHRSLIVVDVRVNGLGPYSFVLDTGATSSCVDQELSAALHLPSAQGVRLATWTDTSEARRAEVQNLSVGSIDSGPLRVLVQSLREYKGIAAHVHGVLGQDVLLRFNYLIDYDAHRIEFDADGGVLQQLRGDRVNTDSVQTRTGGSEARLRSVPVRTETNVEPLQLILDSGADMVVLQPRSRGSNSFGPASKWIANDDGRMSAAVSQRTTLSVGSEKFSAEAWVGDQGLRHLTVDGLLPTSCFNKLYISNTGSFVIFEPRRTSHKGE